MCRGLFRQCLKDVSTPAQMHSSGGLLLGGLHRVARSSVHTRKIRWRRGCLEYQDTNRLQASILLASSFCPVPAPSWRRAFSIIWLQHTRRRKPWWNFGRLLSARMIGRALSRRCQRIGLSGARADDEQRRWVFDSVFDGKSLFGIERSQVRRGHGSRSRANHGHHQEACDGIAPLLD